MGRKASKSELQKRNGMEFINKYGSKFMIVNYVSYNEVHILFENGWSMKTTYQQCSLGSVKSPFCKSVHGVGYLGVDKNGIPTKASENGKNTRAYEVWHNMLTRCYSEVELKRNPTYNKCSVCDRWLNYSLFLEDLPLIDNYDLWLNNEHQGITLDKDIKQPNTENKVYSLETCIFIPRHISSSEAMQRYWFSMT